MGNTDSNLLEEEVSYGSDYEGSGNFIIKFISLSDIPHNDNGASCDPYMKAYISEIRFQEDELLGDETSDEPTVKRVSDCQTTPKRLNCTTGTHIWNCYRDFYLNPVPGNFLTVEVHNRADKTDLTPIGVVHIPVEMFNDEEPRNFQFECKKNGSIQNHPNFTVTLKRVFLVRKPPQQKTFFLLRHGESKWNKAQSAGNISGMLLDRDHALTLVGIEQAAALNKKWKQFEQEEAKEKNDEDELYTERHYSDYSDGGTGDGMIYNAYTSRSNSRKETKYTDSSSERSSERSSAVSTTARTITNASNSDLDLIEVEGLDQQDTDAVMANTRLNAVSTLTEDTLTNNTPADGSNSSRSQSPSPGRVRIASEGENPPPSSLTSSRNGRRNNRNNNRLCSVRAKAGQMMLTQMTLDDPDEPQEPNVGFGVRTESVAEEDDENAGPSQENNGVDPVGSGGKGSVAFALDSARSDSSVDTSSPGNAVRNRKSAHETKEDSDASDLDADDEIAKRVSAREKMKHKRLHQKISRVYSNSTSFQLQDRTREYTRMFLKADKAYSSPLTRAVETALVGLEGHPALDVRGLELYRIIREFKGMGGMDTIGVACGDQIRERVLGEFESLVGKQRAEELVIDDLHYNDASTPWWTPISSFDSKTDQRDRVNEFVSFVRYCDSKMPVFVGHSLFFKSFYSKRLSDLLERNRPELAANLKKYRLSNATVLAVTVLFGGRNEVNSKILDADVLFDGGFHVPHHDKEKEK